MGSFRKIPDDAVGSDVLVLRVAIAEQAAAEHANREKGSEGDIVDRADRQPHEAVDHDAVTSECATDDIAKRLHWTTIGRAAGCREPRRSDARDAWFVVHRLSLRLFLEGS